MPLTQETALRKDISHADEIGKLQHRHYAVIAGIIAAPGLDGAREGVAIQFANALQANPRFDRARFLRACGVE